VGKTVKGREVGEPALSSYLLPSHKKSGPAHSELFTFQEVSALIYFSDPKQLREQNSLKEFA
jgi:hypothetical protein